MSRIGKIVKTIVDQNEYKMEAIKSLEKICYDWSLMDVPNNIMCILEKLDADAIYRINNSLETMLMYSGKLDNPICEQAYALTIGYLECLENLELISTIQYDEMIKWMTGIKRDIDIYMN